MNPTACSPCCSAETETINVPGTSGADGVSAYTTTTALFVVPATGNNVTISVVSSLWMVVDQIIFITGAGFFKVVSKADSTHATLQYLTFTYNTFAAANIASGTGVSAGGNEASFTTPVAVSSGGTGGTTKATGRLGLGVGQDETITSSDATAYTITNAAGTISGITVTAPAAGLYLICARATVDYQGVTFAASRTLTLKARNTTAGTDLTSRAATTGTPTTQQFTSVDYVLPFKTATLAANDIVALQISLSVVASAGTSVVSSASLAIIPINLT